MAEIIWLEGRGNQGRELIWPQNHLRQHQWNPEWQYLFKKRYDYISDYECIFPHPMDQNHPPHEGNLWNDLQNAKDEGLYIPISNIAHFTTKEKSDAIIRTGGFMGGLKKINEDEGSDVDVRLSWWSPLFTNENREMIRSHLGEKIYPFLRDGDDNDDLKLQFAKSDAFYPKSKRYGEWYFDYSITDLCQHYKRAYSYDELQFKVLGTFLYRNEIMHAVLICGREASNGFFGEYPAVPGEGNVIIKDHGNWKWNPQATATEIQRLRKYRAKDGEEAYPKFRRWEHVAFAFHIPDGKGQIFPVDNLKDHRHCLQAQEYDFIEHFDVMRLNNERS